MKTIFTAAYVLLLHLYPPEFRSEFADEMQNVFADTISDAAKYGNRTRTQVDLRQIFDLIPAIIQEHLVKKMSWLNRYKRVWRVIELVLLLVAIMGPWVFDRISVPSQYTCSAPDVRLDNNFCGIPMPGTWILSMVVAVPVNVVVELITGTAVLSDRMREFAVSLLLLLLVLPFISTLLMILGRYSRRRQVFHIIALGLAASFALFIGTDGFSRLGYYWALWGIWLYIGLTASALVLEMLALIGEKETRLGISRPS